jgi:glucose-6-phosphate-specific signal transduction histidine kinase
MIAKSARAVDPSQPATSYIRTTFTVEDGLSSNVVNAIIQTRNGFLWLGTDAGRSAIQHLRSEQSAQGDLTQWLNPTAQELAASQSGNGASPAFRLTVEGERRAVSDAPQEEICRITREILQNAFRHSQAGHIEAEVRYDVEEFRIRIRDDGKGSDQPVLQAGGRSGHRGLRGVLERAQQIGAHLDFWSEVGAGTEVQLTVTGSLAYQKARDKSLWRLFRREANNSHS